MPQSPRSGAPLPKLRCRRQAHLLAAIFTKVSPVLASQRRDEYAGALSMLSSPSYRTHELARVPPPSPLRTFRMACASRPCPAAATMCTESAYSRATHPHVQRGSSGPPEPSWRARPEQQWHRRWRPPPPPSTVDQRPHASALGPRHCRWTGLFRATTWPVSRPQPLQYCRKAHVFVRNQLVVLSSLKIIRFKSYF